jgi:hypothetical protein
VLPESDQHFLAVDHLGDGVEHALPDAGQVTQVENVVELGRRRKHFYLEKTRMNRINKQFV